MHKFWTGVARFFAFLFSILFVLTALLAVVMSNVDRRLLNASTYKNVLSQQQVYGRLPRVIAEQLFMSMNGTNSGTETSGAQGTGGAPPFIKQISVSDWETIVTTLFPPEALKSTTDDLVDRVFAFLNGRQATVDLDLTPFKTRLAGQAGIDSLLALIRAQPACTPNQAADLQAELAAGQPVGSLCRPPEEELNKVIPTIKQDLDRAVNQIPDRTTVEGSQMTPAELASLVNGVRLAHLILRASPDVPLFFLLLISLLAVRTPRGWLLWWGIPFLSTGVFSFLLSALASAAFERIWVNTLANRIPASLSLGAVTLGHDVLRGLVQVFLAGIVLEGIFFCLAGAGMLAGSAFLKPKAALSTEAPLPSA
jgi:hypothetical protein